MHRRGFLQGSLALVGLAAMGCPRSRLLGGKRLGVDSDSGHRLRDGKLPQQVGRRESVHTAILGGGISALTVAWKLSRCGFEDFKLYELEAELGGNSRATDYPESPAPWGAHYLPIPTKESVAVRELLADMGLYSGLDAKGQPQYDSLHLCHSLEERLFIMGRWETGLETEAGGHP